MIDASYYIDFANWLWQSGEIWGFLVELVTLVISAITKGGSICYHSLYVSQDI